MSAEDCCPGYKKMTTKCDIPPDIDFSAFNQEEESNSIHLHEETAVVKVVVPPQFTTETKNCTEHLGTTIHDGNYHEFPDVLEQKTFNTRIGLLPPKIDTSPDGLQPKTIDHDIALLQQNLDTCTSIHLAASSNQLDSNIPHAKKCDTDQTSVDNTAIEDLKTCLKPDTVQHIEKNINSREAEMDEEDNTEKCGKVFSRRVKSSMSKLQKQNRLNVKYKTKSTSTKSQEVYSCSKCNTQFSTLCQLKVHEQSHSDTNGSSIAFVIYKCAFCELEFLTLSKLLKHQAVVSVDSKHYKCDDCGESFVKFEELKVHIVTHSLTKTNTVTSGDKQYKCDNCDGSFIKFKELKEHISTHSLANTKQGDLKFKCKNCDKRFNTSEDIKEHHCLHSLAKTLKTHPCDICFKEFPKLKSLKTHRRLLHKSDKNYKCDQCIRTFSRRQYLERHKSFTHSITSTIKLRKVNTTSDRKLEESVLESDNNNQNLHDDKKTEENDMMGFQDILPKPFKCDVCGNEFSKAKFLSRHKLIHGSKRYICDYCGDRFTMKTYLRHHLRIHTGERNYVCQVCGKAFGNAGILHRHRTTHSDEKPFICHICGKSFKRVEQIKRHSIIHTGQKPYVCELCGRGFTQSGNLKTHMKTHRAEKNKELDYSAERSRDDQNFSVFNTTTNEQISLDESDMEPCTSYAYNYPTEN